MGIFIVDLIVSFDIHLEALSGVFGLGFEVWALSAFSLPLVTSEVNDVERQGSRALLHAL